MHAKRRSSASGRGGPRTASQPLPEDRPWHSRLARGHLADQELTGAAGPHRPAAPVGRSVDASLILHDRMASRSQCRGPRSVPAWSSRYRWSPVYVRGRSSPPDCTRPRGGVASWIRLRAPATLGSPRSLRRGATKGWLFSWRLLSCAFFVRWFQIQILLPRFARDVPEAPGFGEGLEGLEGGVFSLSWATAGLPCPVPTAR